ncbi:hypothetical protein [Streptomyces sp. NPDC056291]|uniref:hypothetical protein n=1 Tax=unclassified Streptomyces TaxID=2593676 RepID=UPI0035D7B04B
MSNLSKVTKWADILHDLMGLAAGALLLAVGLTTYRHGGSAGWVIAGAVALISTSLWVAQRRHASPTAARTA